MLLPHCESTNKSARALLINWWTRRCGSLKTLTHSRRHWTSPRCLFLMMPVRTHMHTPPSCFLIRTNCNFIFATKQRNYSAGVCVLSVNTQTEALTRIATKNLRGSYHVYAEAIIWMAVHECLGKFKFIGSCWILNWIF